MTHKDNERDQELDELLSPLSLEQPTDLQLQKWKRLIAVEEKKDRKMGGILPRVRSIHWTQVTVAAMLGFVLGAVMFMNKSLKPSSEHYVDEHFFTADATIVHVSAKAD